MEILEKNINYHVEPAENYYDSEIEDVFPAPQRTLDPEPDSYLQSDEYKNQSRIQTQLLDLTRRRHQRNRELNIKSMSVTQNIVNAAEFYKRP